MCSIEADKTMRDWLADCLEKSCATSNALNIVYHQDNNIEFMTDPVDFKHGIVQVFLCVSGFCILQSLTFDEVYDFAEQLRTGTHPSA